MKRVSFEWILYYLQLTFVGVFVLVLCVYNMEVKQKDFLQRGMYTENVQGIQLSSNYLSSVCGEVVDFSIPKIDTGNFMIYKRLSEEYNEIVRGIYGTRDVFDYSSYIKEGRFFEQSDYTEKSAVAVIGSSMLDRIYTENGKQYFGYDNQLYEVIGVFKETDSDLDYTVYLNLTSLIENMDNYGLYYVDAQSSQVIENVLQVMEDNAREKYSVSRVKYEAKDSYGLSAMNNTLLFCAIFAALINLLISSIFFVTNKKYSVAIQKLCGMTKKDLLLNYGRKVLVLLAVSLITIYLLITCFSKYMGFFFELDSLVWQHYAVTVILLSLIGFFVTGHIAGQVDKVDISSTLKGR